VRLSVGFGIECIEILRDRALLLLGVSPIDLVGWHTAVATGVGLQHAGIDGEAFPLDQSHRHCRPHHALEDVPQQIALAVATQSVL
jgi:hypothetical protein